VFNHLDPEAKACRPAELLPLFSETPNRSEGNSIITKIHKLASYASAFDNAL